VPLVPLIPWLSVAASIYLMLNLPGETWLRFGIWMVLGIIVYFLYGRRNSRFSVKGAAERKAAGQQAGGER
jgi:APA family basic amino acid/polyamine antiporter